MKDDPNVSDQQLVAQSQRGSLAAFEQLVYRYEARVFGFVMRFSRNEPLAREVTQDTFVRAFQAILQFDSNRSFIAWLLTIARRKCIDHYRASPPRADEPVPELADPVDPAKVLVQEEERQNLWDLASRRLSPNQFQALWLRYVEEMELEEIACILGKTKTGVKVLLFRARQSLGSAIVASKEAETGERNLRGQPASPARATLNTDQTAPITMARARPFVT